MRRATILRIVSVSAWLLSLALPTAPMEADKSILGLKLFAVSTLYAPLVAIDSLSHIHSGLMLIAYLGNVIFIADSIRLLRPTKREAVSFHPGWSVAALAISAYLGLIAHDRFPFGDVAHLPGFWVWLLALLLMTSAGVIDRPDLIENGPTLARIVVKFVAVVTIVVLIAMVFALVLLWPR